MLGLPSACIVSAMLPKTQYLREHIYQVLFSMLVHPLLQGGHSIVCGDIVSPTTLSREVFLLLIIGQHGATKFVMHLYLLPQCSRCWYRFAKSAMDFFGCCMHTKNSLTVQDSVVDVALVPSLLYSFFEVVRAPLRSVEYLQIGGKRRHTS